MFVNYSNTFLFYFFGAVLLCVFTFLVPCCDVRYDFRIKTMFGSSLPPVNCRKTHVLFTRFLFVSSGVCFVCPRPVSSMLPVPLDCPFVLLPFRCSLANI
jgi:hypothetical protein